MLPSTFGAAALAIFLGLQPNDLSGQAADSTRAAFAADFALVVNMMRAAETS